MLQKLLAQLGWWMVILNFSKTRLQQTLWDEPNVFVITGVTNVVNMDMGLKSWKKLFSLTRLLLLSLTVLPILLIYFFSLKRVYYFPQNEFTIFLKMCLLFFSKCVYYFLAFGLLLHPHRPDPVLVRASGPVPAEPHRRARACPHVGRRSRLGRRWRWTGRGLRRRSVETSDQS